MSRVRITQEYVGDGVWMNRGVCIKTELCGGSSYPSVSLKNISA